MSREFFKAYSPKAEAKVILRTARGIIEDYQSQGLTLTLRQLYYQFVSKDLLPNTEKSYKKLGTIISRGRLGGYLDWAAIEDRVRVPVRWIEYDNVQQLLLETPQRYRRPRLIGQKTYVELWVEKDALAGILRPLASRYHVTMMVNRGYSSSSAMKEAGDRIRKCCDEYGCTDALILYLGDLDPSGEDMVRDLRERGGAFINYGILLKEVLTRGVVELVAESEPDALKRKPYIGFRVHKLALTMDQVEEYEPPPNPTKLTDSRAAAFVEEFGYDSWEVDALNPTTLQDLITEALEEVLDMDVMQDQKDQEEKERDMLQEAVDRMCESISATSEEEE